MKRDMDLIRKILLTVEEYDENSTEIPLLQIDGEDGMAVYYHAKLLIDAGFIEGTIVSGPGVYVTAMTWSGHDFLDTVRSETVWDKTKGLVKEKTGSVSLDVLKALATQVSLGLLGLK